MNWHLDGGIQLLIDADGRIVDMLKHDGEQYRNRDGKAMGRNFTEAQRALIEMVKKRKKGAA